jgi:hypothetical protein
VRRPPLDLVVVESEEAPPAVVAAFVKRYAELVLAEYDEKGRADDDANPDQEDGEGAGPADHSAERPVPHLPARLDGRPSEGRPRITG